MTVTVTHENDDILEDIFEETDLTVRVGYSADYAAHVNYGGDPHWPPLTPMFEWTERMGWDNPGLESGMSEGAMWDEVDRRQNSNKPLPSAYFMAQHIAENGTQAMMFASDAFAHAAANGESWLERQNYDDGTSLERILKDFGNWTLEESNDRLVNRVSSATTGKLLQSGYPAELVG